MKLFIALALFCVASTPALGECESEMDALSKHQLVIKGMMDMNFNGELNSENADTIGERVNSGQEAQNAEDFKQACDIYESIIKDYGFNDSLTDQNKTENGGSSESEQLIKSDSGAEPEGEAKPAAE